MKFTHVRMPVAIIFSTLLFFGCQSKNSRGHVPLEDALMGHWADEKKTAHYYFSKNEMIFVKEGLKRPRNETYQVISKTAPYTIKIETESETGAKSEYLFVFNSSKTKLTTEVAKSFTLTAEEIYGNGPVPFNQPNRDQRIKTSFKENWQYVDSKEKPEQP